MLRGILSAVVSAIRGSLWLANELFRGFLIAARLLPSVPPVDASEDLAEIAETKSAVERLEDEATVKWWATARLYGRPFELPPRPIAQWLLALTIDDAGRIATADGAGMLRAHLDGTCLFPGLPPVGDFEQTRRWRMNRKPPAVRRETRAAAMQSTTTEDPFECVSVLQKAL
jgi:hypothetical protein